MASPLSGQDIGFSAEELDELQASLDNRASVSSAGRPRRRPPAPMVSRRQATAEGEGPSGASERAASFSDTGADVAETPPVDDRPERVSILLSALKTPVQAGPGALPREAAPPLAGLEPELPAGPALQESVSGASAHSAALTGEDGRVRDANGDGLDEETVDLSPVEVEDAGPPEDIAQEAGVAGSVGAEGAPTTADVAVGPRGDAVTGASPQETAEPGSAEPGSAEPAPAAAGPFPLAADLIAPPDEVVHGEVEVDIEIDEVDHPPRPGRASETELNGEDIEEVAEVSLPRGGGSPFVQRAPDGAGPEVRLRMGASDGSSGTDEHGIMTSALPENSAGSAGPATPGVASRVPGPAAGEATPPRRPPASPPPAPSAKSSGQGAATSKRVPTAEIAQAGPWFTGLFGPDYPRAAPYGTARQTASEVAFVLATLRPTKESRMLDFGCGWGRHCIELAAQGYRVTGVDQSKALLELAGQEARRRKVEPKLVQQDFRDFDEVDSYDAVYCLDTSFGYFEDDANRKVIQRLARALRPGGRLLLEVANRDYLIQGLPQRVGWEGDGCIVVEEVDFSFFTSRLRNKRSVFFADGRHAEHDISIRAYSLHDLGKLLHHAGFRVVEVSGHMAHRSLFFGNLSRKLIVLAEKRPGQ